MSDHRQHLAPDTLQAYLDAELGRPRRAEVEAHLRVCGECAAELDAWRAFMGTLEALPKLEPSAQFRERVLEALPPRTLRPDSDLRQTHAHPNPEALQDLIDGRLPRAARTRVERHLAACTNCDSELRSWSGLFEALASLPRLAPSPGFAARVMASLATSRATASSSSPFERLQRAARGWIPRSPFGRGIAAAAVLAPMIGVLVLTAILLLNPVMEPGELLAFAGWQMADLWQVASSQVLQLVTETSILLWSTGIVEAVGAFPGLAVAGLAAVWATLVACGWVLYRNVVVPHGRSRDHVRASS